jgi:membrane-associated phospholipid phosphatase
MGRRLAAEDALMRLMPRRARRGSTWFGRMGDVVQQPPVWAGVAGVLAVGGGPRGRRAAMRGSVCYGMTAIVANLVVKPFVGRSRPPGSGKGRRGPITSSFPSGHAATDVSFIFGVAQEVPLLLLPLGVASCAAHWSLVRSRGHYPSDVLAGGAVGAAVAVALWWVWPTGTAEEATEANGSGHGRGRAARQGPARVRVTSPNVDPADQTGSGR